MLGRMEQIEWVKMERTGTVVAAAVDIGLEIVADIGLEIGMDFGIDWETVNFVIDSSHCLDNLNLDRTVWSIVVL